MDTKTQDEENRNQRIGNENSDHHCDDQSENQSSNFEREGLICVRRANKKYVDIRTVKFYQWRQQEGTSRPRSM